jgi:hypothetical protein
MEGIETLDKHISDLEELLEPYLSAPSWTDVTNELKDPVARAELAAAFAYLVAAMSFIKAKLAAKEVANVRAELDKVKQYMLKVENFKKASDAPPAEVPVLPDSWSTPTAKGPQTSTASVSSSSSNKKGTKRVREDDDKRGGSSGKKSQSKHTRFE